MDRQTHLQWDKEAYGPRTEWPVEEPRYALQARCRGKTSIILQQKSAGHFGSWSRQIAARRNTMWMSKAEQMYRNYLRTCRFDAARRSLGLTVDGTCSEGTKKRHIAFWKIVRIQFCTAGQTSCSGQTRNSTTHVVQSSDLPAMNMSIMDSASLGPVSCRSAAGRSARCGALKGTVITNSATWKALEGLTQRGKGKARGL